jgi:hypothetical protein
VGEILQRFSSAIAAPDGSLYDASACGAPMPGGTWEGWIEFVPLAGGEPLASPRETTQPNRTDTEYWASGLTDVYLEGALRRAIEKRPRFAPPPTEPSIFSEPATQTSAPSASPGPIAILDPFSVYEKGEAMLRKQLAALSAWHLVNIAREYELTDVDADTLNRMSAAELIEVIVRGVRAEERRTPTHRA